MCRRHLASFVTEIAALSAVEARRRRDKQRRIHKQRVAAAAAQTISCFILTSLSRSLSLSFRCLSCQVDCVCVCVCDRTLLAYLGAQFVTALPISAESTDSLTRTQGKKGTHTHSKLSLYRNRFSSCSCRMLNNCYSCFFFGQQFNR